MGFFLKKYSDSQCCWKKYSDFGGGKKKQSDSEFLSYNLMLNSGNKIRALRDKKNKYSNLCCPKKKFWTKQKTITFNFILTIKLNYLHVISKLCFSVYCITCRYGFFLKKYSDSQCCWKKYSDFGGGKKNLIQSFCHIT